MERCCLDCQQPIVGRADKKFCDDACRSDYNNRIRSRETIYLRKTNNILKRNRDVLKVLNPEGKVKVTVKELQERGFDFDHLTSIYVTKKGDQYRYCYDYGYLFLAYGQVLLVKK